ncbi:MlaE family ABC transporter permease [Thiomicrorhabdus aquaedulcis]|uniref:MlaE family ABC transporter permease n=1 Tax=Thiomicrorhabdus aquaedulcis TaxID=2211106 RepID=UPI000FD97050|nr:ABC transporter permease [Thiomicrorhabdus aquaedulcis]
MQPHIEFEQTAHGLRCVLSGDWTLAHLTSITAITWPTLSSPIELNGAKLERLDTSGAWALLRVLANLSCSSSPSSVLDCVQWKNVRPQHQAILDLVQTHLPQSQMTLEEPKHYPLYRLGRWTLERLHDLKGMLYFIGSLTLEFGRLIAAPHRFRTKEFTNQVEEVLIYALPLAFSMMFLLGIVFSYLLGLQAKQYGANIFVVDGSVLALCRELSPVIVAILVAGRSGAAMTAQLGTMKVYEEIDAMSVLGLSPMAVLVIPRILALLIALPLLVFVGDIAGVLGSMLVAAQQLDITPVVFLNRLSEVFEMKTLLIGLLKAPVFAIFIAVIACYMGLNVAKDARSIGLNTTATVVQSIVAVILINAIIAITLVKLGI